MWDWRLLLLAGVVCLAPAEAVEDLQKDNFEAKVLQGGRNSFVKFYAPWCGHCKALKPAWDKLGELHKESTSVLVGDVDCTVPEAEPLCSEYGVEGFPTLKYFTSETGKKGADYEGGREFEDLEKFVKDTLARKCDPVSKEDCDEQEKAYVDKWSGKSGTAIVAELQRLRELQNDSMKADKRKWLMKRIGLLE
eukprot:2129254-Amphidinium_carterae.1